MNLSSNSRIIPVGFSKTVATLLGTLCSSVAWESSQVIKKLKASFSLSMKWEKKKKKEIPPPVLKRLNNSAAYTQAWY